MARFTHVALIVALCAAVAVADRCLYALDAREVGEACSNQVSCRTSMAFCNTEGVCQERIKANEPCQKDLSDVEPCEHGHQCRGPKDGQICVPNSRVGEPCSLLTNVTLPACYGSLTCNPLFNVCTGGNVGDFCQAHLNVSVCNGLYVNCTSSVCQGSTDMCSGDADCAPGHFCNNFLVPGVCTKFRAVDQPCNATTECAGDSICTFRDLPSSESIDGIKYCTARFSRGASEYCGSHNQLCSEFYGCHNSLCIDQRPTTCTFASGCTADEQCMCGTTRLQSGVGHCAPRAEGCFESQQPLRVCLKDKCNMNSLISKTSNQNYEGSCARRMCPDELDNYHAKCSSAGRVMGGAIMALFVAIVARFVASA